MTNGSRMRRLQDGELAEYILTNFKAGKKCAMCAVGLDEKRRCLDPDADCKTMIYEWLGSEENN